jgi:ketosteroid isomerase-like protein
MAGLQKLDDETVQRLVRHWRDGWNDRDVDLIMVPFADDVVFSSRGVAMMTGEPSRSTVEGAQALRSYVEGALAKSPADLTYVLRDTYVGTDSIVITYSCELPAGTQKLGSDLMRVRDDGEIVEWRCHY